MKKYKFEVLLSTMHRKDHSIIEKVGITSDATIINQCGLNQQFLIEEENKKILWIDSDQIGLSNSRNMAIYNSKADIVLLTDDDFVLDRDYQVTITNYFNKNPNIDICAFRVKRVEDGSFAGLSGRKAKKVGFKDAYKISSVQIAFRRKSVVGKNIKYNTMFGPGGYYSMGDENIFISECRKEKLKIGFCPDIIGDLHTEESVWFEGYNEKFFFDTGAILTGISRSLSILLIFRFLVTKRKMYKKNTSFVLAMKKMLEGRKDYLKRVKKYE